MQVCIFLLLFLLSRSTTQQNQREYCDRVKNATPQNNFVRTLPCSTIPKKIFFGGKLCVCVSVTTDISGTSGPIWLKFCLEIEFVNTPSRFFHFLEKLILKGCKPPKTCQKWPKSCKSENISKMALTIFVKTSTRATLWGS